MESGVIDMVDFFMYDFEMLLAMDVVCSNTYHESSERLETFSCEKDWGESNSSHTKLQKRL